MQALDHGAHLIIVNNAQTYLNVRADVVISEDAAVVIPAIVEKVLHG
jgi:NAD-dependent SIR2 family protein deacetylase